MADLVDGPVRVRSPATSANLGPGFDAFGLALAMYDEAELAVTSGGLAIDVQGQGEADVPRDESHLVVRAIRATLDHLGIAQPGLRLVCRNVIPHGRGLGSSSSAIVSGIRLAESLVPGAQLADLDALRLATELEGHPDNVAACLRGGFTIAWSDRDGVDAIRLDVDQRVKAVVLVPEQVLSTEIARGLLPRTVPHADAVASTARAALLVAALTQRPELLLTATADRLHQTYRGPAMPATLELLTTLRERGLAATISGAGPSVLVLSAESTSVSGFADVVPAGWSTLDLPIDPDGCRRLE